eukprot:482227-Amorphochlora_amoeboformis.AAC.1
MKSQTLKRILIELDEDTSGDLDRSELRELVASIDPRDKTLGPNVIRIYLVVRRRTDTDGSLRGIEIEFACHTKDFEHAIENAQSLPQIKKSGRLSINELRKSLEGLAEAEVARK